MTSFLKASGLLSLICLLYGCGPVYQTTYTMVPPATETGRMCANNCLLSKQQCQQSCTMQQAACDRQEDLEAENRYLRYVNDQRSQGKEIKRSRESFRYGHSCIEVQQCHNQCETDYHICHTNCGGQVIPQTMCVANCQQ